MLTYKQIRSLRIAMTISAIWFIPSLTSFWIPWMLCKAPSVF